MLQIFSSAHLSHDVILLSSLHHHTYLEFILHISLHIFPQSRDSSAPSPCFVQTTVAFSLSTITYQEFLAANNFSFTSCKTSFRGVTKNAVVDDEEEEVLLLLLPPERT